MFSVFHTSSTYVTISSRQIGSFFGYTKIMAGVWRYSTKRTLGIHVVPKAYLYLACVYNRAQLFRTKCWEILTRAPSQYPKRRLFVRSRKVSKPRDWYFKLSFKFQSDRPILNTNLAASRLYEISRKDVFSEIDTGPRIPLWLPSTQFYTVYSNTLIWNARGCKIAIMNCIIK